MPEQAPRGRAIEELGADWDVLLLAVVQSARDRLCEPDTAYAQALQESQTSQTAQSAMCDLVRATSRSLMATVRKVQRDAHEAEDVLQDVYLKLWLRAGSFNPARGNARQWLMSIARNAAVDSVRRIVVTPGANPRACLGGEPAEDSLDVCDGVPCPQPDALESMAIERRSLAVRRELRQLPAHRRDAVQLVFYEEMSHAQLAKHLGRPLGTVKSLLRHSYACLRPMLQAHR